MGKRGNRRAIVIRRFDKNASIPLTIIGRAKKQFRMCGLLCEAPTDGEEWMFRLRSSGLTALARRLDRQRDVFPSAPRPAGGSASERARSVSRACAIVRIAFRPLDVDSLGHGGASSFRLCSSVDHIDRFDPLDRFHRLAWYLEGNCYSTRLAWADLGLQLFHPMEASG